MPVSMIGILVLVVIVIVAIAVFFFAGVGEQTAVLGQTGQETTEGMGGGISQGQACIGFPKTDGVCCPSEECGEFQENSADCCTAPAVCCGTVCCPYYCCSGICCGSTATGCSGPAGTGTCVYP